MRNEIKFKASYTELKRIINKQHSVCQFPQRTINSIYFDDLILSDFVDSEEGTVPREKVRFRWYGETSYIRFPMTGTLEVKKTFPEHREKDLYKLENIDYFSVLQKAESIKKTKLKPIVLVSYTREYFETFSGIRLTLDSNIKYQKLNEALNIVSSFADCSNILELKVDIEKDHDAQANEYLDLRVRFSKYCEGVKAFDFQ